MNKTKYYYFTITVLISFFTEACTPTSKETRITGNRTSSSISETLTVEPLYSSSGSNWNDYVKNDGADIYQSTGTACAGNESTYSSCIHGGEKRKVVITGQSSCSGLSLTDDLGAFDWICDSSSGTATFYSSGLKANKGLKDLLNSGAWKSNRVVLSGGPALASPSAVWWGNPVVEAPANPDNNDLVITLDTIDDDAGGNDEAYSAGTIFTISTSTTSAGYNLNIDKASLVTLSGASLTYADGATDNCLSTTGESSSADSICLVSAGNQKYLWIEGVFSGGTGTNRSEYGVLFYGVSHSRLHRIEVSLHKWGITLEANSNKNTLSYIWAHQNYWPDFLGAGVRVGDATGVVGNQKNRLHHLVLASGDSGLALGPKSDQNVISDVTVFNVTSGIYIVQSSSNTITRTIMSSTQINGLFTSGAMDTENIYSFITTSLGESVYFDQASRNTVHHLLAANNNNGLGFEASSDNTASQIAIAHSSNSGIYLNDSSNNNFAGNVVTGNNALNCYVDGVTTLPGIIDSTCTNTGTDGTSDYPVGYLSSAVFRMGKSFASSFQGKLTSNETTNFSDTSGTATLPSIGAVFDWTSFLNPFRTWGVDGSAFPNLDNKGGWSSGTGRIWDWRLANSDTVLRHRSGNGSTANSTFVVGAACPAEVHGDQVATDQMTPTANTYLLNAMEILDDSVGDEDGLCESDESCIYAPNFGAYQGEGTYSDNVCQFQDDGDTTQVQNVTMHAYSSEL